MERQLADWRAQQATAEREAAVANLQPLTTLLESPEYNFVETELRALDFRHDDRIDVHLRPLVQIIRNLRTAHDAVLGAYGPAPAPPAA